MGHHGSQSKQNVVAIIPARYNSTRLPGKLLLSLGGKPLIINTLEQAQKSVYIDDVIVGTDDQRIFDVVNSHGGKAVMTADHHQSGSDRIAEAAQNLPKGTIIVNVQGDEPLISPFTIDAAVKALLDDDHAQMATTCERFETAAEVLNPNNVKVVTDAKGNALYFSRSPIPYLRDEIIKHGTFELALINEPPLIEHFRKHTGLYVYRREFLLEYTNWEQTENEKREMLEQLRVIDNGYNIKVVETEHRSIGVDTPEDLERVRVLLEYSEN